MENTKVLIVEDENIVALDLKSTLNRLGYDVLKIIRTGEEAIEFVKKEEPELILMDIRLAGNITGIQAAWEISSNKNIPIVFLTAHTDLNTVEEAKLTNPFGYVSKPFDENSLSVTLKMALFKFSMEKKLRESEGRYRELVNDSPVPVFIVCSGKIVFLNNEALKLTGGKSLEDVLGRPFTGYFETDSVKLLDEKLERCYLNKENFDLSQLKFKRLDGETIDIELRGRASRYDDEPAAQIAVHDLTEIKLKENVQRSTVNIMNAAANGLSLNELYLMVHNALKEAMPANNFSIGIYNELSKEIKYEYFSDESGLRPEAGLFSNGIAEYVISLGKPVLLNSDKLRELEKTGILTLRNPKLNCVLAVPQLLKNNKTCLFIIRDYNDYCFSKSELEILELMAHPITSTIVNIIDKEIINSSAGELKSGFQSNWFEVASHDIRNQFNSIMGFMELINEKYDNTLPETVKDYHMKIYNTAEKIKSVLDNLVKLSADGLSGSEIKKEKIALKNAADQNIETVAGWADKKQIAISNKIENDIYVTADRDMLNSIFQNLLSNSIKFTPDKGFINLSAEVKNRFVYITVEDSGVGFSIDEIFKYPENRPKTSVGTSGEKGSGIGLFITKMFIERSGGFLTVESREKQGSRLIFSLPEYSHQPE